MPSVINQNIAYLSPGDENQGLGTSANDAQEELSDVTFGMTLKKRRNAVMYTALFDPAQLKQDKQQNLSWGDQYMWVGIQ